MTQLPNIFFAGEQAGVAEALDENFQFLLNLILGVIGAQSKGVATGTSTANATAAFQASTTGLAIGQSNTIAFTGPLVQASMVGTATGASTTNGASVLNGSGVGAATGTALVNAVGQGAGTTTSAVGAATGTSTTPGIGSAQDRFLGNTIAGTSTTTGVSGFTINMVGTATGTSTTNGVGSGSAAESASGTTITQPSQTIFASSIPGSVSTSLNSFSLSANPGVVTVNGVADNTTSAIVELFYSNHVLYRQNTSNNWFSWASAGVWTAVANPIPPPIMESPEGAIVTTTGNTIYASSTPGVAASSTATPGSGLNAATLTAVPGKVAFNGVVQTVSSNGVLITPGNGSFTLAGNVYTLTAAGQFTVNGAAISGGGGTAQMELFNGVVYAQDGGTGNWFTWTAAGGFVFSSTAPPVPTSLTNLVELYYHNHFLYAEDSSNNWYQNTGAAANPWPTSASPVPTTPKINIALLGNAAVNTTVIVSGTYQAAPAGIPTLQYSDNSGTTWNALPSSSGVTNTTFSFVHPPFSSVQASQTVAVRDAANTGTSTTSNTFQVFTPGVVTLVSLNLSNNTFVGNQPSGTVVGQISVTASGGTFNGSLFLSGTDSAKFSITPANQLITAAVLAAGTYNVTINANMTGAVGSPLTQAVVITATAESASATLVNSVGPVIVGSATPGVAGAQLTWSLRTATGTQTNFVIGLNGVSQTATNAVTQIYYINHTLYQNAGTSWWFYNGTGIVNGQTQTSSFTSCSSPLPVVTLSATTFSANAPSGSAVGLLTLMSAGSALPGVTWALSGVNASSFKLDNSVANQLDTNGIVPAGTYNITVTATIT